MSNTRIILANNNGYVLAYEPAAVNRYAVYRGVSSSPSGDLKLYAMVAQSSILSKRIQSYFTKFDIDHAKAKVHAHDYVNNKFKL